MKTLGAECTRDIQDEVEERIAGVGEVSLRPRKPSIQLELSKTIMVLKQEQAESSSGSKNGKIRRRKSKLRTRMKRLFYETQRQS